MVTAPLALTPEVRLPVVIGDAQDLPQFPTIPHSIDQGPLQEKESPIFAAGVCGALNHVYYRGKLPERLTGDYL